MKMKRVFLGILGLASLALPQSNLSVNYPLGLPARPQSGMALAMGGAATGVDAEENLLFANPANLGLIDKTVFSSLITIDMTRISQGSATSDFASLVPKQIGFGLSFGKYGTFAVGLDEQTDARVRFRNTIPNPDTADKIFQYTQTALSQNGGLTNWEAGWGYSLAKRVYLGAGFQRQYLFIDHTILQSVFAFNGITTSRDSTYFRFASNAVRIGVMVPVQNFMIGFTGTYSFMGDAIQSSGIYQNLTQQGQVSQQNTNQTFAFKMPPSLALGASYTISAEWLFALDVSDVLWGNYYSEGSTSAGLRDHALSLHAGAQVIPAPALLAPKYWETINYRAGIRMCQLPRDGDGEFAFSLGFGLPMSASGMLDISAEAGRRTSERYHNYAEDFFGVSVGINGGRKWTSSPKNGY